MLVPFIPLAAAVVIASGCVAEGKRVLPEIPAITREAPPTPQPQAIVEPWQSGTPLGGELSPPENVVKSVTMLRSWILALKNQGMNTLLLRRSLIAHRHTSTIRFEDLTREAHRQGVRVYAVLNLREKLVDGDLRGWSDASFDADAATLRPSRFPDLLHPEYQALVTNASLELAVAGVDLIVFRFDPPSGPFDGFTEHALDGFRQDFEYRLSPPTLFAGWIRQWARNVSGAVPVAQEGEAFAPEFWRWAGWKNREYLAALDGAMAAVRRQRPDARFGLELHADTMTDPGQALVRYTEDFLESRRRSFDRFIVVVREPGVHSVAPASVGQTVTRMTELLDGPSSVFVLVIGRRPMWTNANDALNVKALLGLQQGVGLGFRRALNDDS